MTRKFKIGDVVELKSGGPDMTVVAHTGGGLSCIWFDDDQGLHDGTFPPETLDLVLAV